MSAAARIKSASELPGDGLTALRVFFRHWSPRILLVAALLAWGARLQLGDFGIADLLICAGLLLYWPLNEWLIHVYILHFRPRETRAGRRLDLAVARDHRRHHADPWNLRWVFIPLHVFPWALPALLLVAWLLPGPELGLSFLAAYLSLSLHYEWSHYLAHINWQPPLAHYARRVREHRLHHFRNHDHWWGVSMGSADRLLGTAPDPEYVHKSPRELHPDQDQP